MNALTVAPTCTAPAVATRQSALVAAWLRHLEAAAASGEVQPGTVATYRGAVARWLDYLANVACTDAPTPATVAAYVAALRPTRKAATVASLLAAVRALYRWAEAEGTYADVGRAARGPRVRKDEPLPALAHAEVAALLRSVAGDGLAARRDRALVAMLYGSAVRCCSLERARVGDVDVQAGTLRHRPKGHGDRDAVVPLPAGALRALADYLAARGTVDDAAPLFDAAGNRRRAAGLTTRSMRRRVLALMESAGRVRRDAAGRVVNGGHYGPHSLRRSALTRAADVAGLEAAQTLAGHASIETTRRFYVRVQRARHLAAVVGALDLDGVPA